MAIIDFISFSYTPEIISNAISAIGDHSKYLSKSVQLQGRHTNTEFVRVTSSHGTFDLRQTVTNLFDLQNPRVHSYEVNHYELLAREVSELKVDASSSMTYDQVKDEVFSFIGYDLLDRICRGAIDQFVTRFNHSINSAGNEWTMRENPCGKFGYKYSGDLLVNGIHGGVVAWGAKNGGCYVSISGSAMAYIDLKALYEMLVQMRGIALTRVDLAVDYYQGEYTCDDAFDLWKQGGFKASRGKAPKVSWVMSGGEYDREQDSVEYTSGRTLYVGDRKNGKCIRIYEKGLQLKDEEHPNWVRWEVQLGNKGRIIPLEIIVQPSKFFKGSYPCLESMCKEEEEVFIVATKKRVYTKVIKKMIANLRTATSKRLCFLRNGVGMPDAEILDTLIGDTTIDDLDEKFHVAAVSYELGMSQYEAEELVKMAKKYNEHYQFDGQLYKDMMEKRNFIKKSLESVDYPPEWD